METTSGKLHRETELKVHLSRLLTNMRLDDPSFFLSVDSACDLPTCVSLMEENDSRDVITAEKWSKFEEQVRSESLAKFGEHEQLLLFSVMSLDRTQVPKSLNLPENVDKQFILAPSTYFVCKICTSSGNYSNMRNRSCYFFTNHDIFVFDPERTAMAQAFSAYLPDEEYQRSIGTKKIKCNICHNCMPWHALVR